MKLDLFLCTSNLTTTKENIKNVNDYRMKNIKRLNKKIAVLSVKW